MYPEIKYRKFALVFGQKLKEVPDYLHLKENGWDLKWSYTKLERGEQVVETLLIRKSENESVFTI